MVGLNILIEREVFLLPRGQLVCLKWSPGKQCPSFKNVFCLHLIICRRLREVEDQNRELLTVAAKREETIHQATVSKHSYIKPDTSPF